MTKRSLLGATALKGTVALRALEIGVPKRFRAPIDTFRIYSLAMYYASARSQICFSDPKFRYRPRPNENCLFRIRWASSMPANVMAALPNDLKPPIDAHRHWLFAGSLRAGQRAAAVMSLVQSAKLNGHDPYRYLKDVLERLPTQPASRLLELLPHYWKSAG